MEPVASKCCYLVKTCNERKCHAFSVTCKRGVKCKFQIMWSSWISLLQGRGATRYTSTKNRNTDYWHFFLLLQFAKVTIRYCSYYKDWHTKEKISTQRPNNPCGVSRRCSKVSESLRKALLVLVKTKRFLSLGMKQAFFCLPRLREAAFTNPQRAP